MVKPGHLACGALLSLAACTEDVGVTLPPLGGAGSAALGGAGAGTPPDASPLQQLLQHPNPIISRSKTTFSSPPGGAAVVDSTYHSGGWYAGSPSAQAPAWVAIELGLGPSRVLVQWDDGGTYNYRDPSSAMVYGLPGAYEIQVSNDSSNGQDGSWTNVVTVTDNAVRTRGHAIDFGGKSWVKLLITALPPNAANGVTIGEIDVHDISATGSRMPDDTWLFLGDSISAFAYDRAAAHQPRWRAWLRCSSSMPPTTSSCSATAPTTQPAIRSRWPPSRPPCRR
jgi:acyl-CoA thioesterase-1